MTIEFEVANFQKNGKAVLQLLHTGFPEIRNTSNGTLEHLLWKYTGGVQSHSVVGLLDKNLVSFYGIINLPYIIDGEEILIGLVTDVMTHPDARRMGLFEKTGRATLALLKQTNVDCVLGYPIRQDVMPGHLKVGWHESFKLPVYVKGVRSKHIDGSLTRFRRSMFFLLMLLNFKSLRSLKHGRYKVLDVSSFINDESFSSYLKDDLSSERGLVKSKEFLKWRLSRPGVEYKFIVVENNNSHGYAVVRINELLGVHTLCVVDFLSQSKETLKTLHQAIDEYATTTKVQLVAICTNSENAKAIQLGRNGYVRTHKFFRLIFNQISTKTQLIWFKSDENWAIYWIDSDTV